jgi:hypothetical protein
MQLKRFNRRLAEDLSSKWEEENKLFRKNNGRETPAQRLDRWKEMSRRYRLYALMELSERWYDTFRKLRADIALITALYQFSEIDKIPRDQEKWKSKTLQKFDSLVLRMKGPRKPSKKKYRMKDLDYDVSIAFLEMVQPLEEWAEKTKENLETLTAPQKKMTYKTKVKRFRNAVVAREYLTILTQSLAPRQKGIKLLRDIDQLDENDYEWIQVFDDSTN